MRVCLLQPPPSFRGEGCCLPADYVGVGILSLEAYLRQQGVETRLVHAPYALAAGTDGRRLFDHIARFNPDLTAVGLNWLHLSRGALESARGLKEVLPGRPVLLGGHHASLFAEEIVAEHGDVVDGVVLGEAEVPLLRACEALAAGGGSDALRGIPGILTPGRGPHDAPLPPAEIVAAVDDLPLFEHRRVWPSYPRTAMAVPTQRGRCARRCDYCLESYDGPAWSRRRPARHSLSRIADQIELGISEGLDIVTLEDPFFQRGDSGVQGLARELDHRALPLFELNVFAEPDSFSDRGYAALAALRQVQRVTVDYGVETGSPRVAEHLGRRLDPEALVETVAAVAHQGILPYTWWMVGLPGEGAAELAETEHLIRRTMEHGGIPRWVTPLVLFPQTALYRNRDAFGIRPRLVRFRHFARFSDQPRDPEGHYPDLITHETPTMDRFAMAAAARHLKRVIREQWPTLEAFYGSAPELRSLWERQTEMLTRNSAQRFHDGSFF